MQLYAKFAGLKRAFGLSGAALYLAGRALARIVPGGAVHRYRLVAQPVPPGDLLPAGRGAGIEVRRLDAGDPALAALPVGPDVLAFRFAQGAVCLGAFRKEEPIGCLWLTFGAYEEDEVRCVFDLSDAAPAAWDFDVWLRPDARLGFGFPRLWDAANALLREKGIAWSFSRISVFSPGSLAAHTRMGAVPVGSLTAVQGAGRQLVFSSVPPRVRWSRLDGALPRYRLSAPPVRGSQIR